MRTLLSIIASASILVCAGCASNSDGSSRSPWAAGATKSTATPKASVSENASARSVGAGEESGESAASVAPAEDGASPLAGFPAIREANRQKALAEIEAAKSDSEPFPVPEKRAARVVNYDRDCSVVQFDTQSEYRVGEKVVLTKGKENAALVSILAVSEGGRYIAEEVDGILIGDASGSLSKVVEAAERESGEEYGLVSCLGEEERKEDATRQVEDNALEAVPDEADSDEETESEDGGEEEEYEGEE